MQRSYIARALSSFRPTASLFQAAKHDHSIGATVAHSVASSSASTSSTASSSSSDASSSKETVEVPRFELEKDLVHM
ncbi:hypothetical protein BCR33DRAFT_711745 [Rhizoclosmatium globosum]|uniref:Uncharacterized protein n=1 Tax=Rhizoclosmatium globosum TaxID=329046 RepID=A0A1Y2CZX2_9FUNG|nr:hypothetical protein BCR33DRAFT_711745 [Rhizoclosmatium globosum]|eukprot:ORY52426.1 hypothetical protein BCR33DRAFT_711745 [Rhizoclosmatium globosum]